MIGATAPNRSRLCQTALEALIRFSDEELKHQALFRRVEALVSEAMPAGYSFSWNPNDVAAVVLGKSSWAVLALTLHIELFTQAHYRESIRHDAELSEPARDVFRFHWREECQHAIMEWRRVDAARTPEARDSAVDELIELVSAVDSIVTAQASADTRYFTAPYDADAVTRFFQALVAIKRVLNRFRTGFIGKVSPVHLFWGSFDLAVTRFSVCRCYYSTQIVSLAV